MLSSNIVLVCDHPPPPLVVRISVPVLCLSFWITIVWRRSCCSFSLSSPLCSPCLSGLFVSMIRFSSSLSLSYPCSCCSHRSFIDSSIGKQGQQQPQQKQQTRTQNLFLS